MKAFLSLLCLASFLAASLLGAPAIVAHPDVKVSALSKEDAKNILLGTKSRWDDGTPIRLAVLKSGPSHEAAIQAYTSRSTDQFEKFWKKQVFTGKGIAPDSFDSEADLVAFVARTPGAVGYVGAAASAPALKALPVN